MLRVRPVLAQNAGMTERPAEGQGTYQRLPVVGSLLRRQRREAERVITGLVDATMRDTVGLNAIVRRLNIDPIIARLDIGAIASRLDIAAIVDRLDIDALLARIDINAIIARLDIDAIAARIDVAELVARLDSAKRDDQPADDVGPLGDGG
jgi:hypothetical protein